MVTMGCSFMGLADGRLGCDNSLILVIHVFHGDALDGWPGGGGCDQPGGDGCDESGGGGCDESGGRGCDDFGGLGDCFHVLATMTVPQSEVNAG